MCFKYWRIWVKEYMGKTTDLSHVTEKHCHIMLYRIHLAWTGFEFTTLVVIGTDYIGSCKFNYHTIMITMVPILFGNWFLYRKKLNTAVYPTFNWYSSYLKMYTKLLYILFDRIFNKYLENEQVENLIMFQVCCNFQRM